MAFTETHPVRYSVPYALTRTGRRLPEIGPYISCAQGQQERWYGAIQAMLGKLYILSLFYTL